MGVRILREGMGEMNTHLILNKVNSKIYIFVVTLRRRIRTVVFYCFLHVIPTLISALYKLVVGSIMKIMIV